MVKGVDKKQDVEKSDKKKILITGVVNWVKLVCARGFGEKGKLQKCCVKDKQRGS